MTKVALIACASQKLRHKAAAKELYTSALFKLSVAYARKLRCDEIMILSAKHGLIALDTEIEPYDLTLKSQPNKNIKHWADDVLRELQKRFDLQSDHFILFAGQSYRKYLVSRIASVEIPLEGLPIGKQLHYLRAEL